MAKKILGLIGSYRKKGNSEITVREIARLMGPDHDLELVSMSIFSGSRIKSSSSLRNVNL